jgi:uncharacterized protein YoxC
MLDVLAVLVAILVLAAIFIGNELSHINTTLRECLGVLNEISNNTDEIKDNTSSDYE